jgi:hypothetical protein
MSRLCAGLILFVCISLTSANANNLTAKVLFDWCNGEPESFGDNACTLYISGFVHGIQSVTKLGNSSDKICLSDSFAPAEGRAVFMRIMRKVPKLLDLPMAPVLWGVLSTQYSCPKKPN